MATRSLLIRRPREKTRPEICTQSRTAIKRGAYLVVANWPVVVIQFVAESTFKLLLAVPVVGGAVLVAIVARRDLTELLAGGWREMLAGIAEALATQPAALVAFVFAFTIVLLAGSALMFLIKGGTMSVLVAGERAAGPIERPPLRLTSFRRAAQFSIEGFLTGCASLFPRYFVLGLSLLFAYLISGAAYLGVVVGGYQFIDGGGLLVGWTMIAALCSSGLIVWITLVNLLYLLVQMAIAIEDVSILPAMRLVFRFVRKSLREVGAVFGIVLVLVLLATAASILATAGLGLISFVPLVGLAVFPLQVVALAGDGV